jgi:sulfide:quinone oxidoreductase
VSRHQVLIAGGGVAALEAALALRAHAGSHVDVTLVAPETHFTYRPLSVGQPFGLGGAVRYELSALARNGGFAYRRGTVAAVDPDRRCVSVDGEDVVYDSLILALGARASSAVDGAVTFDGPRSVERVARALAHLSQAGGGTAAFVAPPGVDWTLPIYELALMTSTWAAAKNLPVEVLVATGETGPLAAMGRVAEEALTEALDERGIDLHVSLAVRSFAWASLHHDAG